MATGVVAGGAAVTVVGDGAVAVVGDGAVAVVGDGALVVVGGSAPTVTAVGAADRGGAWARVTVLAAFSTGGVVEVGQISVVPSNRANRAMPTAGSSHRDLVMSGTPVRAPCQA